MSVSPADQDERSAPVVRVLMYHQVGLFPRPRQQRGLYCRIASFRRQMAYLQRSGFSVISLREAREGLFDQGRLAPASVVLTFDDGFQNFADHAWPVLQAYDFPATVFAVAGRLGQAATWMSEASAGDRALMDATTLRALADQGLDVGSHTTSHQRLGLLERDEQQHEIVDSKARLEDALGRDVPHFCYPYGHYNAGTRDLVAEAGYHCALTCKRDRADRATNAFEIPRQGISFKDTLLHYAWKLRVAYR